jgi:hypothetical protein
MQIEELVFTRADLPEEGAKREGKKVPVWINHYPKNMSALAARLGFTCTPSLHSYPMRDHWLRRSTGDICTFCFHMDEETFNTTLKDIQFLTWGCKAVPRAYSCHPYFKGSVGHGYQDHPKAINDLPHLLRSKEISSFLFYFEGGNHWIITHPNDSGRRLLLIGEDNFHVALHYLILTDFFRNTPGIDLKNAIACELRTLTPEKIAQTLPMINSQMRLALHLRGSDKEKCAAYLAQMSLLRTIIGRSFIVPEENIFMIPQLAYHLDVFSHPGPKGSMFVQDYGLCVQLLEQIKVASETLGLTPKDKEILERYLSTARQLNEQLAPLQAATKASFAQAGITVIPTPGIFFDTDTPPTGEPTCNVNFLNSITGWSPTISNYYYVTAGAQAGDRLGGVLMDAFTLFLQQYQKSIDVHFIGGDPAVPGDFAEAMAWWNYVKGQAGPHCLSFEKATKAHTG